MYYKNSTNKSEMLANRILNNIGIACRRNNLETITDVDLITSDGYKIDVQYSRNFARYGDCRIDIVSAFFTNNNFTNSTYTYDSEKSFLTNFESKYNCDIRKPGKIFLKEYVDAIIILFYDNDYHFESMPDHILIFRVDQLLSIINKNPEYYFEKIKVNDKRKHSLSDAHGSAFMPIDAKELAIKTGGFFGAYDDLVAEKERVKKYLSN